jgi:hypothetical protein
MMMLPSSPYPQRGNDVSSPAPAPVPPAPSGGDPQEAGQTPYRLSTNLGGDDTFDYISAYVTGGDDGQEEEQQMMPPQSGGGRGYGQGRFTTNLDDGLR